MSELDYGTKENPTTRAGLPKDRAKGHDPSVADDLSSRLAGLEARMEAVEWLFTDEQLIAAHMAIRREGEPTTNQYQSTTELVVGAFLETENKEDSE